MNNEEEYVLVPMEQPEVSVPNVELRAKKKPEPFCKNCMLYDWDNKKCKVVILYAGEKINLPMIPEDPCFYENEFIAVDLQGNKQSFKPEVQQVKMWVENPLTGERSDQGVVKIEYPEHLFEDRRSGY